VTPGRFRPLLVWGVEPDSTLSNTDVTPCNTDVTQEIPEKLQQNQRCNTRNTCNTEKRACLAVRVHDGAGEGSTSGVYFRPPEYQGITPEQAGMVQCGRCGYGQDQGKSEPSGQMVIRCRHDSIHGGLWPVLAADLWRRCAGHHQKKKGTPRG
jgi:hypothetical protein